MAEERYDQNVEVEDFDNQDPEYKELLSRILTIQADCEIGGPHLYVEDMIGGAPGRTNQIVVARTAAEEIDHFRKMAFMAGQIGTDVSHVLKWPNEKRYVEAFRTHIQVARHVRQLELLAFRALPLLGHQAPLERGGARGVHGRGHPAHGEDGARGARSEPGPVVLLGVAGMVDAAPNTYKLDGYLKDMIQAVYSACSTATAHMKDDEKTVDKAIDDCEEVLTMVMDGHVDEWVA